jgi:hypothetical protein
MNSSEKKNCEKDLEDILLCNDIEDIKRKVKNLKKRVRQNKLGEKLWRSPYGNEKFIIVVFLGLFLTLLKLAVLQNHWYDSERESQNQICYDIYDIIIYFFWLLAPPICFLYEYIFLFGKNEANRLNSDQITDLKYCQELASKTWAAVVICLSFLLYVRYGYKF